MKKLLFIAFMACLFATYAQAQPKSRRDAQQTVQKTNANNMTTRAQISFPTMQAMNEDVVWRRDIYRELDLTKDANAGLYYPVEPVGTQMNLFTYVFKLMLSGQLKVYEYRMDGNEVFNDSARVKPLALLDNYHIYYERQNNRLRIDNSDIPSREVKGYYIKESAYYDQATSSFHKKVEALCPIMYREDDFGDGTAKYPLFWVKYDDLAPFLSKQTMMTSNVNNAATMSVDDYFTMNKYDGKIYKTNNMLGQTLAQYCPDDSAMVKEQKRIEDELKAFEKNVYGDQAKKDSLDSIANAKAELKVAKKKAAPTARRTATTVSKKSAATSSKPAKSAAKPAKAPSSAAAPRVSARRERH